MIYRQGIIFFLLFFIINNCSYYSFKGSLPPGINSIAVVPIKNNTSQSMLSNNISNSFNELLISENILDISDLSTSDSKLEIVINSLSETPYLYSSEGDSFEKVEEIKLLVEISIKWLDMTNNEVIIEKKISEWSTYNPFGLDMSSDSIDNDLDGLVDSEDSDEYGPAQEGAMRIVSEKLSKRIINELTSTW